MRWKQHPDPDEFAEAIEKARVRERRTLSFVGLVPEPIVELVKLFAEGDRQALHSVLREEGLIWAASTFEDLWKSDEAAARRQGLFDHIWHRRACELDPFVAAPDFSGFDILLDTSREFAPKISELLAHADGNNPHNLRRREGPEWWRAWHQANQSASGGWLDLGEVRLLSAGWPGLATPEFEQACLTMMGASYTHPGCWTLLETLGGFFAQCASEARVVVVEVDI